MNAAVPMAQLESAQKMEATPAAGHFVPVTLNRETEADIIFISCKSLPELFLVVKSEDDVRNVIDRGLKGAFSRPGRRVQVFTNGKISGPTIDAMVRLLDGPMLQD